MNQGSSSPHALGNCSTETIYRFWNEQATLRTQMQNKCVELSLQITTALAVGVFALMFHEVSNSPPKTAFNSPVTKGVLIIALSLYTFLQLSILASYLYHTFVTILSRLGAEELELSQPDVKAIRDRLLHKPDDLSESQKPDDLSKSQKKRARNLRRARNLDRFQPIIIYFSVCIGALASIACAFWLFSPPNCFWVLSIPILSLCLMLYMACSFHTKMHELAPAWLRDKIEEQQRRAQSTGAQPEGQGRTP